MTALCQRGGNGGDNGYRERGDERGGEIEQRLRLAVNAVEHLCVVVAEAGGALEPVHAEF